MLKHKETAVRRGRPVSRKGLLSAASRGHHSSRVQKGPFGIGLVLVPGVDPPLPVNIDDVSVVHVALLHRFVRLPRADGQGHDVDLQGQRGQTTGSLTRGTQRPAGSVGRTVSTCAATAAPAPRQQKRRHRRSDQTRSADRLKGAKNTPPHTRTRAAMTTDGPTL